LGIVYWVDLLELFECWAEDEHEVFQEAELSAHADSENDLGGSPEIMYFVGWTVVTFVDF